MLFWHLAGNSHPFSPHASLTKEVDASLQRPSFVGTKMSSHVQVPWWQDAKVDLHRVTKGVHCPPTLIAVGIINTCCIDLFPKLSCFIFCKCYVYIYIQLKILCI